MIMSTSDTPNVSFVYFLKNTKRRFFFAKKTLLVRARKFGSQMPPMHAHTPLERDDSGVVPDTYFHLIN